LRNQILSSEYHVYACGKIFLRASILNEIPNFSSSPSVWFDPLQRVPQGAETLAADQE
jgi:hypothetical protein